MNTRQWRWIPLLAVLSILFGCAGEKAHREGIELMEVGQVKEGLAKLEEATREAPGNLSFRADLLRNRERLVNRMLVVADNERKLARPDEAEVLYERVLELDRENARAKAGLSAVQMDRRHADLLAQAQELFKKNDLEGVKDRLQTILMENPGHSEANEMQRKLDEQLPPEMAATPSLKSKFKKPVTLQFRDANLKMVFEALSRTAGINILLDKDVKSDLKTTLFVKEASVEDTIDLILLQNQLEKKILSENTVFVYPNQPSKTKDYQDLKIRSFHLTNADAKQMLAMIKMLLKTKDIYIHEKTNSLIMRDTPEAIRLAEKLIADQDLDEPEVMLEVEVLEVKRSKLSQLGIKFPDQLLFSVSETPSVTSTTTVPGGTAVTTTTPALPLTLEGLRNINSSVIKVNPISLSIDLKKEDGDTNVLASPRIRVRTKEKAKIHIGDRVPIITNTVTPVSTGTPVVTGNVQYLDVGLKLEVEPDVHLDGEVAIKVFLEVSSIVKEVANSSSGTVAYQIGTRTATTVLRLMDGETQILAGLISDEDRNAASKVPGLGDLPVLGRLFSSHRNTSEKTEIVLSITPRLIRNAQRPDARLMEFWTGTETSLRTEPLTMKPMSMATISSSGAAAKPPVPAAAAKPQRQAPAAQPGATATPEAKAAGLNSKSPSSAGGNPLVFSWQGPATAKVGEQFKITLNAQTTQGVSRLPFLIGFDTTALKVEEVSEGDLLRQGNRQSTFSHEVDEASGQIFVELADTSQEGATGQGSLVTVTFQVISPKPQARLTLISASPGDKSGQILPFTLPVPHSIALNP